MLHGHDPPYFCLTFVIIALHHHLRNKEVRKIHAILPNNICHDNMPPAIPPPAQRINVVTIFAASPFSVRYTPSVISISSAK